MNRINLQNNNINTSYRGKTVDVNNKEIKTLSNEVTKAVKKLARRAEREVYQDKEFASVVQKFNNPDKSLYADEIILQVRNLPASRKGQAKDYDTARWLELVVKGPLGDTQSTVIKRGNKKEILEVLNDKNLAEKINEQIKIMSDDLRAN